jgi:general secretion pathway protein K
MIFFTSSRGSRGASRDGFIIVAVLWILAALATLVSVYAIYVSNSAASIGLHGDRLQAEMLVSAGVELSVYQLIASREQSAASREQSVSRGAFGFRMGAANVSVEFRSEAARIDINAASKELLAGLFVALGAKPEEAESGANRIVGWRTAPQPGADDAEPSLYRAAGKNYIPRGAPFQHINELSLVLGLSPTLIERALPYLTVYNGRAEIHVLDAAPEVIAALPGMSPERLRAVLYQREMEPQNFVKTSQTLLGPAARYVSMAPSNATQVTIRINFDSGRRTRSEVVVLILDGDSEPFRVLSWRDDMDEPPVEERTQTRSK